MIYKSEPLFKCISTQTSIWFMGDIFFKNIAYKITSFLLFFYKTLFIFQKKNTSSINTYQVFKYI